MLSRLVTTLAVARKTYLTNAPRVHWSQFGEDVVLRELFRGVDRGIYVDVGCHHPRRFSNTHFLHRRGWRGVNVDLEPEKIRMFELARPRDCNVVAAVSDRPGTVKLYRARRFGLETTIDAEAGRRLAGGPGGEVLEVEARTLDDILAASPFRGRPIDLLTVDAEGHDLEVLRSIDLGVYRPTVVVAEARDREIEAILAGDIHGHLAANGYALCSWVHLSLIYRRRGAA